MRRVLTLARLRALAPLLLAGCGGSLGAVVAPGQPLAPCPLTPNCVSTEAPPTDARHAILPVPFGDPPTAAQARAQAALLNEPRVAITLEQAGYLRAEATSLIFRFVDDVEVVVDSAARVFRFRSASRIGRGDMGVNRARMTRVGDRLRPLTAPPGRSSPPAP